MTAFFIPKNHQEQQGKLNDAFRKMRDGGATGT